VFKEQKRITRRKFFRLALGTGAGALLSAVLPKRVRAEGGIYTVKLGDTLYEIAQRYGLTLGEITQANPQIEDVNLIEVSQTVYIPNNKEHLITPEKKEIKYPIYWGNRSQPEVALTFDDGFSQESIKRVLVASEKNDIQGTFFVIGRQLEAYPDLWRQAAKDGHQICNHTYTHRYLTGLSDEEIGEEMNKWEQAVKDVLGERYLGKIKSNFPYVRFPGGAGHKSERVLGIVEEMGYIPIAWSQDTYSAVLKKHKYLEELAKPIADEVKQYTVKTAQNGSIILLHFNVWDTLNLDEMIAGVREKGLKIKNVGGVLD